MTLQELLERVEKADGPDRELDARIWKALNPDQQVLFDGGDVRTRRPAEYGRLADLPLDGFGDWEGIAGHIGAPCMTASVDAALALVETKLPGWSVVCGPKMAVLSPCGLTDGLTAIANTSHGKAATRAPSIVAALLRALAEREAFFAKETP